MAEEGLLFGDRVWFYDTRTQARRMAVSSHPEHGLVVISLWQGDACTATFRLRTAEAARLIATLAHGMAAELPVGAGPATSTGGRPSWWRQWFARVVGPGAAGRRRHLRIIR